MQATEKPGSRKLGLREVGSGRCKHASIEITGIGSGNFHVGAVSVMAADDIDGFQPDTIAFLKRIRSGFWRFAGNYTSNYYWYDAIGDRDKYPPLGLCVEPDADQLEPASNNLSAFSGNGGNSSSSTATAIRGSLR